MLLQTKDGIKCDLCSTEYKNSFNYYSIDCSKVHVDVRAKYTTKATKEYDFDVCELCWEGMRESIMEYGVESRGFKLKCELCGHMMAGKFDYYYAEIHYVPINKDDHVAGEVPDGLELNAIESKFCLECIQQMKSKKSKAANEGA